MGAGVEKGWKINENGEIRMGARRAGSFYFSPVLLALGFPGNGCGRQSNVLPRAATSRLGRIKRHVASFWASLASCLFRLPSGFAAQVRCSSGWPAVHYVTFSQYLCPQVKRFGEAHTANMMDTCTHARIAVKSAVGRFAFCRTYKKHRKLNCNAVIKASKPERTYVFFSYVELERVTATYIW